VKGVIELKTHFFNLNVAPDDQQNGAIDDRPEESTALDWTEILKVKRVCMN
jgi:allantoicase